MNIDPPSLTLEKDLTSYSFLLLFLFLLCVIILLVLIFNPKGLTMELGYEILITYPILILLSYLINEVVVFKNTPQISWLSKLPHSTQPWFLPVTLSCIFLIALAGLFAMLTVGGTFSKTPPKNNNAMLLNLLIIIIFLISAGLMYSKSKKKDDAILQTFPKALQDAFNLRTKYTLILAAFMLGVMVLYFIDPWGIMTNYGGPVIFFTLFVGIVFAMLITIYQYFLANPSKINTLKDAPGFISFFLKGIYVLVGLVVSGSLIFAALKLMGVFDQDASKPESWAHIVLNLVLFCTMLGIIYKLFNAGGFLDKNPYYRLVLNTLLYIPCLLVTTFNYFGQLFGFIKGDPGTSTATFTPPKPFEIKMLLLSLILLGGYFLWFFLGKPFLTTKYLKQGGQQLINQPIQTDVLTNITSYQKLSGADNFNYQYALSFWFYIDSFPPSTNSSYLKIVPILSYGENPLIKYSSADNTLYITVKQTTDGDQIIDYIQKKQLDIKPDTVDEWKSVQGKITDAIETVKEMPFGNDIDAEGHRIIYKHPDVLLQKWNHVVLNYNGGTLDVFYNGRLVKSAIEVVPYMKLDMLTVGTENGISGNIANLMYFKQPLDILTINTLYTSLKNTNPPAIPENKQRVIPL